MKSKKNATNRTVYDVVTDRIIEYIEKNSELPWNKPWATIDSPQQNFFSHKQYRGVNIILTGMQGFSSPYWLTSKQVASMGGKVKYEEYRKSTPIIFWAPRECKDDDETVDDDKKKMKFTLRFYPVYNAEQIEGIQFPEFVMPVSNFDPLIEAERVIKAMPNCPSINKDGQSAFYSPSIDSVTVPKPERFINSEGYYSALFHELAHSTGHPSRLNRFNEDGCNHSFGSKSYSKEELVAEMSSAFILNTIGINTEKSDRNSAAYVKSWLKQLKDDPRMILNASGKAEKAANYIMNKEADNVLGK